MAIWESVKNFMGFETDDYEEEEVKEATEPQFYEQPPRKEPKIVLNERKNRGNVQQGQMQVVIVKPERFDDVTAIADHINAHRSIVLNLETVDRDLSRRILDFISGATYANHGTVKKVAQGTYMITPGEVDISGEDLMEDYSY